MIIWDSKEFFRYFKESCSYMDQSTPHDCLLGIFPGFFSGSSNIHLGLCRLLKRSNGIFEGSCPDLFSRFFRYLNLKDLLRFGGDFFFAKPFQESIEYIFTLECYLFVNLKKLSIQHFNLCFFLQYYDLSFEYILNNSSLLFKFIFLHEFC